KLRSRTPDERSMGVCVAPRLTWIFAGALLVAASARATEVTPDCLRAQRVAGVNVNARIPAAEYTQSNARGLGEATSMLGERLVAGLSPGSVVIDVGGGYSI